MGVPQFVIHHPLWSLNPWPEDNSQDFSGNFVGNVDDHPFKLCQREWLPSSSVSGTSAAKWAVEHLSRMHTDGWKGNITLNRADIRITSSHLHLSADVR
jgi:hypothetical protein